MPLRKSCRALVDPDYKPWLEAEARKAWELQQEGLIREIYFTDDHCAVLILEALDKAHAREIVDQLPLVQQKLIDFDLMALTAYPGFARLFK